VESLFVLVPLALIFIVVAIKVFSWAVHSGQYDDLDTEAHRILFDDSPAKPLERKPLKQAPLEQPPLEAVSSGMKKPAPQKPSAASPKA